MIENLPYRVNTGTKTHCKRGHERVPGTKHCVKCRRLRDQRRYADNPELRERKRAYQRQWRKDFVFANGYWPSWDRRTV